MFRHNFKNPINALLGLTLTLAACGETEPVPTAQPYIVDCTKQGSLQPGSGYTAKRLASFDSLAGLSSMRPSPDGELWYATLFDGRMYTVPFAGTDEPQLLVDLSAVVIDRQEMDGDYGLFDLAFHPEFSNNSYAYLFYTAADSSSAVGVKAVLARYQLNAGESETDSAAQSEAILATRQNLLELPLTGNWHIGGAVAFGPDGYLYIALGDSRFSGAHGQNRSNLFSTMLRLDVDGGSPYAIPPSNPDAAGAFGQPEIFAYGLRSPWKWSFDRQTGQLWLADVGEDLREEVNIIEAGGNYGWPIFEGTHCHDSDACSTLQATDYVPPVFDYERNGSSSSVIGGYVYRGNDLPGLFGKYIYADFSRRQVFAYDSYTKTNSVLLEDRAVISFAEDRDGELYLVTPFSETIASKLVSAGQQANRPIVPQKLSDTGCWSLSTGFSPQLDAYDVNSPLWSDGLLKTRFIKFSSSGARIDGDGNQIATEPGTILIKNFIEDNIFIETRFLVFDAPDLWRAFTYQWHADGSDATLLEGRRTVELPLSGHDYDLPQESDCFQCHNRKAAPLGITVAMLNRTGSTAPSNQLDNWLDGGQLAGSYEPNNAYPNSYDDSSADVDQRARVYLDVNCAMCHQPSGLTGVDMDLRYTTSFGAMNICDIDNGRFDSLPGVNKRLVPGQKEASAIYRRMHNQEFRMPPLATLQIDAEGAGLIGSWIDSLAECP